MSKHFPLPSGMGAPTLGTVGGLGSVVDIRTTWLRDCCRGLLPLLLLMDGRPTKASAGPSTASRSAASSRSSASGIGVGGDGIMLLRLLMGASACRSPVRMKALPFLKPRAERAPACLGPACLVGWLNRSSQECVVGESGLGLDWKKKGGGGASSLGSVGYPTTRRHHQPTHPTPLGFFYLRMRRPLCVCVCARCQPIPTTPTNRSVDRSRPPAPSPPS